MTSVCVLSAAWRRFDVTRLVLQQRQWLCGELAARGLDAVNLIVADDENLEIAAEHGCETLEAPNHPLGAKCNRGLQRAARIADYVVWVGSDDWIHPDVFDPLCGTEPPKTPVIVTGRRLCVVDLRSGVMQRIDSPSAYGAIPWIIDSRLLRRARVEPIRPDLSRGLDGALVRGIRLGRLYFEWTFHDPHEYRCIDFKTSENITPFRGLARNLGYGPQETDPWPLLAERYPAMLVDEARRLSGPGGTT